MAAIMVATAGCGGAAATPTTPPTPAATPAPTVAPSVASTATSAPSVLVAPSAPAGVVQFGDVTPGSGTGLKIGFIQLTLASTFPQAVQASVQDQVTKAGAKLVTCDSKLDAQTALNCATNLKQQGVNGLITFQADTTAAPRICAAGPQVPVIAVDIEQQPCQKAFMGAANYYAGQLLGYAIGNYFSQKQQCQYDAWVSLEAFQVGAVNDQRMGGIRDAFAAICGTIHDLHKLDSKGAGADIARGLMTDTLTALPGKHRIIVVSINEDAMIGAVAAARAAGRADDLYMGVQNFAPENCSIYTSKNWIGSVDYFPEKYGQIIVPYLIKLMKGEQVPAQLLVPHVLINGDNAKQYYPAYSC